MLSHLKITVEPYKGANISKACSEAKILADWLKRDITFSFNGVSISTENKSITEMIDYYVTSR